MKSGNSYASLQLEGSSVDRHQIGFHSKVGNIRLTS